MPSDVAYEVRDEVAWVTLNRPSVRNALRDQTVHELDNAFATADADSSVRAMVLTGAGTAFCAGQDLREAEHLLADSPSPETIRSYVERLQDLTTRLLGLRVPTVACVNGAAIGAGAELALVCDIRVGGRSAVIQFPEVLRGQLATNGSTELLARFVGPGRAALLTLTGRAVDSERAERWGLLDLVVADDELRDETVSVLTALLAAAPAAFSISMRRLRERSQQGIEEVLHREVEDVIECLSTSQAYEAAKSFFGDSS